jgi:hypothetical protein
MEPEGSLPHSQVPASCHYREPARSSPYPHILLCLFHTKLSVQVQGFCKHFVTGYVFTVRSSRTTPCRLSPTAYSIYSQLPSILEEVSLTLYTKEYKGIGGLASRIHSFYTRWRWLVSFILRPPYLRGKSTDTQWMGGCVRKTDFHTHCDLCMFSLNFWIFQIIFTKILVLFCERRQP